MIDHDASLHSSRVYEDGVSTEVKSPIFPVLIREYCRAEKETDKKLLLSMVTTVLELDPSVSREQGRPLAQIKSEGVPDGDPLKELLSKVIEKIEGVVPYHPQNVTNDALLRKKAIDPKKLKEEMRCVNAKIWL